jgi:hypothetical protein
MSFGMSSEPSTPKPSVADQLILVAKRIRSLAEAARATQPPGGLLGLTYVVAMNVVKDFLGLPWMERHVMGKAAPTDFFRNDWASSRRTDVHVLRLVSLANLLANLQFGQVFGRF